MRSTQLTGRIDSAKHGLAFPVDFSVPYTIADGEVQLGEPILLAAHQPNPLPCSQEELSGIIAHWMAWLKLQAVTPGWMRDIMLEACREDYAERQAAGPDLFELMVPTDGR